MKKLPHPAPDITAPGQESCWDYPRPAIAEETARRLKVVFNGVVIAETNRGVRTLETSHPPGYYFPSDDVAMEYLQRTSRRTLCEWKGQAHYFDLIMGDRRVQEVGWGYARPTPGFALLKDFITFYPGRMDACFVDGEEVTPQAGPFYGGWITSHVAGPFKGPPGTEYW